MCKFFILLSALLVAVPATAQADLYKAMVDVYYHNPALTSQRENLKAVETRVDQANSGWRPYVAINADASLTDGKMDKADFNSKPRQLSLDVSQNLFEGFKTDSQIKSAKFLVNAEKARLYDVEQSTFLKAINAYVDVLNAQEVLTLQKKNRSVITRHYELYKQKFQVGLLKKTDVAQAEARLERAKTDVIDAEADYQNTLEAFRNVYGYVLDSYIPIKTQGTEPLFPQDLDNGEITALKDHPSILYAKAMKKAAEENITVAKSDWRPSLDLRMSASKQKDQIFYNDYEEVRAGLYLSVPLYDRGMTGAKTSEAKYTAAYYTQQESLVERNVVEALRQAWNNLNARRAAIQSANIRIKANKMALDGVKDEQERGTRTVLDVLDAEQELLDSNVALIRAKHGEISAYFSVIASVGNLTVDNLKELKEHVEQNKETVM